MLLAEVVAFLEKIDAYTVSKFSTQLNGAPLELRIIGKSALILGGLTDTIGTADLDSLWVEGHLSSEDQKEIIAGLMQEFGKSRQLVHGYYLEFVEPAIPFLLQRPTWLPFKGDWKILDVTHLEKHETVVSKLFSAFSRTPRKKDRQDIQAALDQKIVELPKVLEIADRIFDLYRMDARSDRFESVHGYIHSQLIPDYGPATLHFVLGKE